jgi:glucose-6-phosphate 1-dehydrogenase
LAELQEHGWNRSLRIVAAARDDWDDEALRRHVAEKLERHAPNVSASARDALVRSVRYAWVDFNDPDTVADALAAASHFGDDRPPAAVAAYLALPPAVFPAALGALGAIGLPAGSRVVVEKPFGEDLRGAVALNELVTAAVGSAGEAAIFRVDHTLGMATVHNLLAMRLANPLLEAIWNGKYIEEVEILWEETLALEGRARYYDQVGALKDVVQNHVLQLLCLVAMEPPAQLAAEQLRDRKVDALRAIRPLTAADVAGRTRHARYTAGRVVGADGSPVFIPGYADEEGIDASRGIETFVEMVLDIPTPRWEGTVFRLRAGKALADRRKGIVVRFRPGSWPAAPSGVAPPAELRIGIDGPLDLSLTLQGVGAPRLPALGSLIMTAPLVCGKLSPYGRVLLNVLEGDSTLSIRGDEAEQAWRVVEPVLEAWAEGRVPLEEYPAGSSGPPRLAPMPSTSRPHDVPAR